MSADAGGTLVLSTLEFDMLWEAGRLPQRHAALDVPSPGVTHSERARLEEQAWTSLAERGLATGHQAAPELVDMLNLLAHPKVSVDVWVWADRRISGLAVGAGGQALLGVLDAGEVWLISARDSALSEAAVSVAGASRPGVGRSVSLPHDVLVAAEAEARGDARALVTALEDRAVPLWQAQELAGMLLGIATRGQFGVQRIGRAGQTRRAGRVVAFHDTDAGRYLFQVQPGPDGRDWATVAPSDNTVLAGRIRELLDEVVE